MAARTGLTPQELYDRYSLKVAAKQAGQGNVLSQPEGVEVGTKPGTQFLQAESAAGLVGGNVRNGALRITSAEVAEEMRGQGEGIKLYTALVDNALAQGLRVFSDATVEADAVRMYQGLERRGYTVRRLEGGTLEDGAVYGKNASEPAFEVVAGPVFNQSVSTRLPTAKKALENPLEQMLVIGLDAAKADPKAFEKNIELIRQYPNFRDNKSASTPDKAAEQFIKHVVDNLLWLYDQVPADTRERSKLWYDGARAIVDRWVPKYNITDAQAAGMLAVLSPQKDWFQNVSLAERVLDIMATKQDFTWSDEMSQTAAGIGALVPEDVGEITGKRLGDIDSDYLQAIWVRVYDQTYNERGYRVVSPEGDFTDWVYNADGVTKSKTAWGSFNEIGKAGAIFKDGAGRAAQGPQLLQQHLQPGQPARGCDDRHPRRGRRSAAPAVGQRHRGVAQLRRGRGGQFQRVRQQRHLRRLRRGVPARR